MVYRIYVEKKEGFGHEAKALLTDARELLEISGVENIRVVNRYDVEDIEEQLFLSCVAVSYTHLTLPTTP